MVEPTPIKKEGPQYLPMVCRKRPLREDVVGQAGDFIDDFILATESEGIYKSMGVSPDKTFLITGPPGTGKTLGIEALVNQANAELYEGWKNGSDEMPKLFGMEYDIGKYGTAYINMGSKIAQGFFNTCYALAQVGKVMVVMDEAEVLFGKRSNNHQHKEDSKLLDTIMKNMQKLHDMDNLYAVLMSNYPDAFDSASIRAGRIDKRYEFGIPNESEREFAYTHTIRKINEKAGYKVVRGTNPKDLARLTEGWNYADIVESVKAAVKQRAQELSKERTGKLIPAGYITQKRVIDSIHKHNNAFHETKRTIGFT